MSGAVAVERLGLDSAVEAERFVAVERRSCGRSSAVEAKTALVF